MAAGGKNSEYVYVKYSRPIKMVKASVGLNLHSSAAPSLDSPLPGLFASPPPSSLPHYLPWTRLALIK